MAWPEISSELNRMQQRLDFRRLHYFSRIVEARSMSAAAVALRVAQPALSKAVRSLEDDLGLVLLHRSSRGVRPTAAGLKLLERAHLDLMRESERSPTVRLGLPFSVGAVLAAPLLEAALERLPNINIQITEKHTPELTDRASAGTLDLAMISSLDRFPELVYDDLVTEEMFLVAPDNKHGADMPIGRKGPVAFAELRQAPLLLPTPSLHLRILIEKKFDEAGVKLENVRELDVFSMILNCLDAGLGYSILPAGWIHREVASKRLRAANFADRKAMSRVISLCRANNGPTSKSVTAVWRLIRETTSNVIAAGGWMSGAVIEHGHIDDGFIQSSFQQGV
jgi:LysR family transcriptional regulator, nitrogen assimilation regulatory protein